jgi:hypothetical protein
LAAMFPVLSIHQRMASMLHLIQQDFLPAHSAISIPARSSTSLRGGVEGGFYAAGRRSNPFLQ